MWYLTESLPLFPTLSHSCHLCQRTHRRHRIHHYQNHWCCLSIHCCQNVGAPTVTTDISLPFISPSSLPLIVWLKFRMPNICFLLLYWICVLSICHSCCWLEWIILTKVTGGLYSLEIWRFILFQFWYLLVQQLIFVTEICVWYFGSRILYHEQLFVG